MQRLKSYLTLTETYSGTFHNGENSLSVVVKKRGEKEWVQDKFKGFSEFANSNLPATSTAIRLLDLPDNCDIEEYIHSDECGLLPFGANSDDYELNYRVVEHNGPKLLVSICRKDELENFWQKRDTSIPFAVTPALTGLHIPGRGLRAVILPFDKETDIAIVENEIHLTYQKIPYGILHYNEDEKYYLNEINKILIYFAETKLGLNPLKDVVLLSKNRDLKMSIKKCGLNPIDFDISVDDEYLVP